MADGLSFNDIYNFLLILLQSWNVRLMAFLNFFHMIWMLQLMRVTNPSAMRLPKIEISSSKFKKKNSSREFHHILSLARLCDGQCGQRVSAF